jgi:Carboxypeptidase regulatory-like domain
MSRSPWGTCVAVIVTSLFALGPSGVLAQSTASISGAVKDTAGSVMPGVTVTVKNDASGATQEVLTDGLGRYQATALGAGSYTVSAALTGF